MSAGPYGSRPFLQSNTTQREEEVRFLGHAFQNVGTFEMPKTPVLAAEKQVESPSSVHLSSKRSRSLVAVEHPPILIENNLTCPFASIKPSHVGDSPRTWSPHGTITPRPDPQQILPNHEQTVEDPIAAESRQAGASSPPPSVDGSTSKCPIRFLDQHSPEEVAEYFKHHKHELPRSHEVCVRRYQSNSESIRQLDAKYGNLVTMIQDLGIKHQSLLPNHELFSPMVHNSMERVKKWADNVNDSDADSDAHSKSGLYQKPLDEVKVGESADMPWGVRIPREIRRTESVDIPLGAYIPKGICLTESAPSTKDSRDSISCQAVLSTELQKESSSKNLTADNDLPSSSKVFCPREIHRTESVFSTRDSRDSISCQAMLSTEPEKKTSSKNVTADNDDSPSTSKIYCPRPACLNSLENDFRRWDQLAFHILDGHSWKHYEPEVRPLDSHDQILHEPQTNSPTAHEPSYTYDIDKQRSIPRSPSPKSQHTHPHPSSTPSPKPPTEPPQSSRPPTTPASYPAYHHPSTSASASASAHTRIPFSASRPRARKRPSSNLNSTSTQRHPPSPQIVFRGPVFIGYGPEDAVAFMRLWGKGEGDGGRDGEGGD